MEELEKIQNEREEITEAATQSKYSGAQDELEQL